MLVSVSKNGEWCVIELQHVQCVAQFLAHSCSPYISNHFYLSNTYTRKENMFQSHAFTKCVSWFEMCVHILSCRERGSNSPLRGWLWGHASKQENGANAVTRNFRGQVGKAVNFHLALSPVSWDIALGAQVWCCEGDHTGKACVRVLVNRAHESEYLDSIHTMSCSFSQNTSLYIHVNFMITCGAGRVFSVPLGRDETTQGLGKLGHLCKVTQQQQS